MKKTTILLAAALVLSAALTSCEKEEANNKLVFHGTVENTTKMEVNGTHLLWNYEDNTVGIECDYISIFDLAGGFAVANATRPTGVAATQRTGSTADFEVVQTFSDFNTNATNYLALKGLVPAKMYHPSYSSFADNVLCIPEQEHKDSYYYTMPMIAYSTADDPNSFYFKNTSALVKIIIPATNITNDELDHITITSNKQVLEAIAYDINADGSIALRTPTAAELGMPGATEAQVQALADSFNRMSLEDIDERLNQERVYYIAVHPNTFSQFTIDLHFANSNTVTRRLRSGSTLTLARNTVTPITITLTEDDFDNNLDNFWK